MCVRSIGQGNITIIYILRAHKMNAHCLILVYKWLWRRFKSANHLVQINCVFNVLREVDEELKVVVLGPLSLHVVHCVHTRSTATATWSIHGKTKQKFKTSVQVKICHGKGQDDDARNSMNFPESAVGRQTSTPTITSRVCTRFGCVIV